MRNFREAYLDLFVFYVNVDLLQPFISGVLKPISHIGVTIRLNENLTLHR
jgi:hypothetical protein